MFFGTNTEALTMSVRSTAPLDARDVPKRILSGALGCGVLAYYDHPNAAAIIMSVILFFDVIGWICRRAIADTTKPITKPLLAALTLRYTLASATFMSLAAMIFFIPHQSALLIGMMFLFSVMFHACITHGLNSFLSWFYMGVFSLSIMAFAVAVTTQTYAPPSDFERWTLLVFCVIWVSTMASSVARMSHTRTLLLTTLNEVEARAKQLNHMARHDAMTGLLNRFAFDDFLAQATKDQTHTGVILIDLDRFKPINDTYGHAAGDAVLIAVAKRIQTVPGCDTAARIGGDEFAVILTDITDEDLSDITTLVIEAICKPVRFNTAIIEVFASAGRAMTDTPGVDPDALCRAADKNMYQVKIAARDALGLAVRG